MTLVVIGNGNVSFWFLKKLGERGYFARNKVIVFSEEAVPAYDRISLSQLFEGTELAKLTFAPEDQYQQAGIELHLGDPIVAVDTKASEVKSKSGRIVRYDQLVFATGSRAFLPPLEGIESPGVFTYRSTKDVEAILATAMKSKSACVVGGGFLGVELVECFQKLGLNAHIIEHNPGLFPRQMDQICGQRIAGILEKKGIHVHLLRRAQRIVPHENRLILEFKDQEFLGVDMVVFAVGIRPRDELAKTAGIQTGPLGGIAVNSYMETSDPKVFAIGECVYFANKNFGLVSPGYQMAEVLAACLSGERREFSDKTQAFSQECFGIRLASFGHNVAEKQLSFETTLQGAFIFRKLLLQENIVVGAYGVGDWPEISKVQALVDRQGKISSRQMQRFEREGSLWSAEEGDSVIAWPDDAIVCNCLSLSKGYLCQRVAKDNLNAEQLIAQTRAATICGQCKPLVNQLARSNGGTQSSPFAMKVPRVNWLTTVSIITVLAVIALVSWPLPPFPQSYVQTEPQLWVWGRQNLYLQITGFSAVAFSVIALLFSLRKRTLVFGRKDNMKVWYILHATFGLLGLFALIFHSGGKLGSYLNGILSLIFILTITMGGLAGIGMGLTTRMSVSQGRMMRASLAWGHILLFWLYPVLLVVHIFSSYYFR